MRRKKPPKGSWGSRPPSSPVPPPPDWVRNWDSTYHPRPGDPAPNHDAIRFRSDADRERHAREAGHGEPAYRDSGSAEQAISAMIAREAQQLREAREADAEHIKRLKAELAQATSDLSGSAAQRASLADHVAWQEEIIRQRNAEIKRQQAIAAERSSEITAKNAEARELQAAIGKLESAIERKDADARRQDAEIESRDAAIRNLEAAAWQHRRQAEDAAPRGAERSARRLGQTAEQQDDRIIGLEAEVQYHRERVAQLETENERLRKRLARWATARA